MNKALQLIGLAYVAQKVVCGEEMCLEALRNGELKLVLLATDASSNTKKLFKDKTSFYKCELIEDYSSIELSNAIGKTNRMVIGIKDSGFAKKIKEIR